MSNQNTVLNAYRTTLGRANPDAEGLAYWTSQLDSGTLNASTLADAMKEAAKDWSQNDPENNSGEWVNTVRKCPRQSELVYVSDVSLD